MIVEKYKLYSYVFTLSIVLLPILNSYEFPIPKIGLGEFLLIVIMVFGIKSTWDHFISGIEKLSLRKGICKEHMKLHWPYAVFLIYSVFITIVAYFFTPSYSLINIIGRLSRQLLYGFILIIYTPLYFKPKKAFMYYKVIMYFAAGYLILQILLNQFGYSLYPNFIPSKLLYIIQDSSDYRYHLNLNIIENFRPTSFFLEPAYYAQYAVPFIAIGLFMEKQKKSHWLILMIVIITVFVTKSANGIAYLGLVLFTFCLHYIYKKNIRNKYLYTAFVLLFLANIFAIFYYLDNNYIVSILSRFNEVGIGKGNTSGNIRILRGFLIFAAMSGVYKVFGFGFGNYLSFKDDYRIFTEMDQYVAHTDYMSGFTQILTSGGIVGITLFLYSIFSYSKKTGIKGIILAILLIVMMLSSSFYASSVYLLIMSFIISYAIENKSSGSSKGE